jgi:acyl CoA:acetate/3-ketoacid CoA transferase beta subunit
MLSANKQHLMKNKMDRIVRRAAREINDGMYVNLGYGMATFI